ncbi:GNAT family N-acetyltransferase [Aureibaculum sp. 2210JD6-5]|uniref:GNAT family N-acetyltransferase n=1 Tax=Aureibaculum sp. 2210JD6-5 TaxID=3103957 RepID=UPI002AAEE4C8|nr:GNAT family N-acetyltransferase [Aureibaculum sp. 2210JD6-5]MDY7396600.1 GNAT family N-acetyltransferase [Aureibaculum sp. 2210JD6-5]
MITIKEITSKSDLKKFVKFPFSIFKDNPYWIPPIIKDELEGFDKTKNPALDNAKAHFFLAYENNHIVGRVAAIINFTEINQQGLKKMRFGWFDVIDNIDVTKALLDKVNEIGKQHNLEYIEGPLGFSNLDKVGVLSGGFDQLGNMITWYSHPYYKEHFEQLGYVKEKEFIESIFSFNNVKNPAVFQKAQALIKRRYSLKSVNFTKTKEIMPYVDEMFDLFNVTYTKLPTFVPISEKQKAYFKKKYISFINPEYIKFVADKEGKIIAFSIVMPSFAKALQKANGKLFPFGLFHLLNARKNSKEVLFYLIGIRPDYQNKGVTAIIFDEYYKVFKEKGIENCIRSSELEENHAIHQLWKNFDPIINKRRRTYRKDIRSK